MITYKDILTEVNTAILDRFPDIEIQSNDVSEGFKRPSFFVRFDNVNKSASQEQIKRSMTIRIYYFPKDRYQHSIEMLDVQEQLESVFDLKLNVLGRKFNINEVSTEVVDGVLEFTFDIEYEEGKVMPEVTEEGYPIEIMKELDFERVN